MILCPSTISATHATQLLAAGYDVKVVQERLGHASAKMTLDVYAHCVPSLQKEAAADIDAMYRMQAGGVQMGVRKFSE